MLTPSLPYKEVIDIMSKDLILGKVLDRVISVIHADHLGITRCKLMARSYVWLFGLNDDKEMSVRSCKCFILNNVNVGNVIANVSECFPRF
ncbi:hypothetical protein PR048_027014 [Dryococelus australis]|uniref:Uncharacterized protein n=1 Tax=Dryococelus australis TaxID=614101 RepID=A0ABQ9GMX7_9NEOP|nr:hypothetical protein PR048_027014 [Dryococelus australis]